MGLLDVIIIVLLVYWYGPIGILYFFLSIAAMYFIAGLLKP